jgi:hypothetical protein
MDSQKVLYSAGKNDENYTPLYAVLPIVKHLPEDKIIWCPFDDATSNFVGALECTGRTVVHSHISLGQNYYEYEPEQWDIMVSNPPFTGKRQIFERVLSFDKPFALLMSNTWLNDSAPKQLFMDKDLQLLMFDQRIDFSGDKKITFSSSYFCYNLLPKQIIMEKLDKHAGL